MKTFSSMFTGGGLADIGAMQAGYTCLWGVEYEANIAEWYCRNIGGHIIVDDVRNVDYSRLPRPDHLHASPPCTNASVANAEGKETETDKQLAEAACRALRALQPDTFTLENVYGYRRFQAFQNICDCLTELDYWFDFQHLNAADFGVPQTRKRLILRATRAGMLAAYPSPTRWIGWYEAIEHLLPGLKESSFAKWQLERLPLELRTLLIGVNGEYLQPRGQEEPALSVTTDRNQLGIRALLVEGDTAGDRCPTRSVGQEPSFALKAAGGGRVHRAVLTDSCINTCREDGGFAAEEPAFTVKSGAMRRPITVPKAVLVNESSTMGMWQGAEPAACQVTSGRNVNQKAFLLEGKPLNFAGELALTGAQEPVPTLTASEPKHPKRAWTGYRIVAMSSRCLARFQSVPDWYELPEKAGLASTIIGNGISCLLMKAVMETFA